MIEEPRGMTSTKSHKNANTTIIIDEGHPGEGGETYTRS